MVKQRRFAVAICLAFAAGLAWTGRILVAGAFGVVASIWTYLDYSRNLRRRFLKNVRRETELNGSACLDDIHRLESGPAGLHCACPSTTSTVPWPSVTDIEAGEDRTFIFLRGGTGLVIPRSTILRGDYDQWRRQLLADRAAIAG